MHEIYAAAVPIYQKMKENPPDVSALCPCVNDIVGNGILVKLSKFAQGMRFYDATADQKQKEVKRSKRDAKYKKWTGIIPAGDVKKIWDNSIPKEFQKRSADRKKYDNMKYKKWSMKVPQGFQKRSARKEYNVKKYKKWTIELPKAF